jgi:hypothetical protein
VLAADAAAAADSRGFKALTAERLLERSRALVASSAGMHGMRSLSLSFSALDAKGIGAVPRDAAKFALFEHGVSLGADEFAMMFAPFERQGGLVATGELLGAMRAAGQQTAFSAVRAEAVAAAYAHLAASAGGSGVTVGKAKASFDAKWDPRVLAKRLQAPEALLEFQRQWPLHKSASQPLTPAEFDSYYREVSACVPSDAEFAEMVLNCWHVPDRGSWKLPKSMRVLVTLHKGSSTEAVIPRGEELDENDFDGLCVALDKRCHITGVARVKVLGDIDVNGI